MRVIELANISTNRGHSGRHLTGLKKRSPAKLPEHDRKSCAIQLLMTSYAKTFQLDQRVGGAFIDA
jgi:hypothetical protein